MSNLHGLTAENLLCTLPDVLRGDESLAALAAAIADVLAQRTEEIQGLAIYAHIDELPEALLDILAVDFKVDWYDPNYTLAEKRKTIKDNWRVHRMLGTKAAVETAIAAIYPGTQVKEWWEYSGDPYHFKLMIDATFEHMDPERHRRVLERVEYYKNLRSVLDEVDYFDLGGVAVEYTAAACVGSEIVDCATAERYQ